MALQAERLFRDKEEAYNALFQQVSSRIKELRQDIENHINLPSNQYHQSTNHLDSLVDDLMPIVLPPIRESLKTAINEIVQDTATSASQTVAECERLTAERIFKQLQPLHRMSTVARMSVERSSATARTSATSTDSNRSGQLSFQPSHS